MQQDGMLARPFLPDRSITYSTASSIYGRDLGSGLGAQEATGMQTMSVPQPGSFLAHSSYLRDARELSVAKRKITTDDPIQTHLLLQTALGDSSACEILSLDELDLLKKEANSIASRIESLKRRLVLETKLRDAARSLSRLQSTPSSTSSSPRVQRRGSSTVPDSQLNAYDAHTRAEKTCDSMAKDLSSLENRQQQIQTRLLQHTAGVLQMTHHGYSKLHDGPGQRPESPVSFDGHIALVASGGDVNGFDELMLDDTLGLGEVLGGSISARRMKASSPVETSRGAGVQQRESIRNMAQGLENLNDRVAAVLALTNTRMAQKYLRLPEIVDEGTAISFTRQLEHLQQGLEDILREQSALQKLSVDDTKLTQLQADLQESLQENLTLQHEFDKSEETMNARIAEINAELCKLLSENGSSLSWAWPDGDSAEALDYMKARINDLRTLWDSSNTAVQKAEHMESVLRGLWSFMLGAEEELQTRRRAEREYLKSMTSAGSEIDSEDQVSPDEDDGMSVDFSLQAFKSKMQWLVAQALYFEEKSSGLRRKVKAQRKRAERSIEECQVGYDDLQAKLSRANELHANARNELHGVETRSKQLASAYDEKDAHIKSLQSQLSQTATEARDAVKLELAVLETKLQEAQQKCTELEQELANNEAGRASETASSDSEVTSLRSEVARLKTDLTICQAELEGAYGSRSQKAADFAAAADAESSKRLGEVLDVNAQLKEQMASMQTGRTAREGQLERELAETIREFEQLTKAAVETEREREDLEAAVDKYRDRIDELEAQIAEDSVKWLGVTGAGAGSGEGSRSPGTGGPGPAGQSMGVVVLKNEFKKMMREVRMENSRQIRAEQDERKRLEGIIRILKQSGGK